MGPLGPLGPCDLRDQIMAWNIRQFDDWSMNECLQFVVRGFPRKLCLISGISFSILSGGHWASFISKFITEKSLVPIDKASHHTPNTSPVD